MTFNSERAWLFHASNRDVYPMLGTVQAVITDPPYGAHVHHYNRTARGTSGEIEFVQIPFGHLGPDDMSAAADFLTTRCEGWGVLFSEYEQATPWRTVLGPDRLYWPMVWIKPNAKPNFRGDSPGVGHEFIQACWLGTGRRRWNGGGKVGVFYHSTAKGRNRHPTEKPVSLMRELIRLFTNPGDVVLDPFMGCGSTGVAAIELGRRFIGIEQNEDYYREAQRRIEEALSTPALFDMAEPKQQTLLGDSAFGNVNTRKRLQREARERQNADAEG